MCALRNFPSSLWPCTGLDLGGSPMEPWEFPARPGSWCRRRSSRREAGSPLLRRPCSGDPPRLAGLLLLQLDRPLGLRSPDLAGCDPRQIGCPEIRVDAKRTGRNTWGFHPKLLDDDRPDILHVMVKLPLGIREPFFGWFLFSHFLAPLLRKVNYICHIMI